MTTLWRRGRAVVRLLPSGVGSAGAGDASRGPRGRRLLAVRGPWPPLAHESCPLETLDSFRFLCTEAETTPGLALCQVVAPGCPHPHLHLGAPFFSLLLQSPRLWVGQWGPAPGSRCGLFRHSQPGWGH